MPLPKGVNVGTIESNVTGAIFDIREGKKPPFLPPINIITGMGVWEAKIGLFRDPEKRPFFDLPPESGPPILGGHFRGPRTVQNQGSEGPAPDPQKTPVFDLPRTSKIPS